MSLIFKQLQEKTDDLANAKKLLNALHHASGTHDFAEIQYALNNANQKIIQLEQEIKSFEKFFEDHEKEIQQKNQDIELKEKEIEQLKQQINQKQHQIQHRPKTTGTPLLCYGQENDLYDDEILSFTRKILEYALKNQTHDKSRQQHILQDLLHTNPLPHDLRAEKEKMLDQTMKTYSRMDNATRQKLEEIGFSMSENGAHYKLLFMNDTRYTATAPKSGSDHKGGKNFARDVGNILF